MSRFLLSLLCMGCSPTVPSVLIKGEVDTGGSTGSDGGSDGSSDGADGSTDGADGGTDGSDGAGYVEDGEVETVPGMEDDDELLFDESRIPEFYITLSDASIAVLESEGQWDDHQYVEAMLTFEGVTYGPIGLRMKGENSWRPFNRKSSLKMDFNRYEEGPDRFYGLKGLTFQAMNEDYSMMHERVAYRVYRELGVPAVRAHHAVLYVNGELYGLFTMLDSVNDQFLERNFTDPSGSMWEQHDGDYVDGDVTNPDLFQHEEGEDNRAPLQAVADALENSGPEALAAAGEHLDWTAFHRYWAAGGLVMNFDAYPFRFRGDDCHVYHDPERGKLVYIPHGVDESFYSDADFQNVAAGIYVGGHLSARCLQVEQCRDDWANIVYDGLEIMEALDIAAYAEEVRDQIDPWVNIEPDAAYTRREISAYQLSMIDLIQNRRASVDYYLGGRP